MPDRDLPQWECGDCENRTFEYYSKGRASVLECAECGEPGAVRVEEEDDEDQDVDAEDVIDTSTETFDQSTFDVDQ